MSARNVELDEGEGGQASRPDPQLPALLTPKSASTLQRVPGSPMPRGEWQPGSWAVTLVHSGVLTCPAVFHVSERLSERLGQGAPWSVCLHLCSGAMLCTKLARGRIAIFSRHRMLFMLHTGPGGRKPVCRVDKAPHGGIKTVQRRGQGPDRDGAWTSSRRNKISLCVKKGSLGGVLRG